MEVAEIVLSLRTRIDQMGRLARVLTRLKPTLHATGTVVACSDHGHCITFHCQNEKDAVKIGHALHLEVELRYQGASALKQMSYEVDGINFDFRVPTIRPISFGACEVKRRPRPSSTGWWQAKLYFWGVEIASLSYQTHQSPKDLKMALWERAVRDKASHSYLDKYDLVL